MKTKLQYRSDIDGLRAVAVLTVVFFHFGIKGFEGGFVGVDVFFVISGYLITKIILGEIDAGTFTYLNFYTRRSRRLIPALFATIAATYSAGFFLFYAQDFAQLSGSTISAILAVSNIFFWLQADYFDTDAVLKPLLHTWSLSVEFQFYLVWPFFLLMLKRFRSASVVLVGVAGAAFLSFAASLIMLRLDATGAFYLTPFRIFEFALGGLVVFMEARRIHARAMDALYILGLAAILMSVLAFDERTPFPGYSVLLPASGAALMLYSGGSAKASRILQFFPMPGIGKISYSLYLVHWPLWVMAQYVSPRAISGLWLVGLIGVTFGLALILYAFVERVFRDPKRSRLSSPLAFNLAFAVVALFVVAPAFGSWLGNGWVWRMQASVQQVNNFSLQKMKEYVWIKHNELSRKETFKTEGRRVLVLGDSQAGDFINMFEAVHPKGEVELASRVVYHECGLPFVPADAEERYWRSENTLTINSEKLIGVCKKQIATALNSAVLPDADEVVIAMAWRPEAMPYIEAAVQEIRNRTKAKIYILGRKDLGLSSIQLVNKLGGLEGVEAFASKFKNGQSLEINKSLQAKFGAEYVDVMSVVCPDSRSCIVLNDEGKPIFWDTTHLTREGARLLGRLFFDRYPYFLRS